MSRSFGAKMFFLIFVVLLCGDEWSVGQQGGVPIRIPDSAGSRCINPNKDRVWVTLRRVIAEKNKAGWFTENTNIGVMINAAITTDQDNKPVSFPLMTTETLRGFSVGQVSVPLEYTIVNGLRLQQDKVQYTAIRLNLSLLNGQDKNKWGNALQTLATVTQKLPIPPSPYTQAASYVLDFANKAVDTDLNKVDAKDQAQAAELALNFDPSGACSTGDFEQTGTIAVLTSTGITNDPMFIQLGKVNDYCWTADLKPSFVLKAAARMAGKDCKSADYVYKQVANDYVGFFVNAVPFTTTLGEPSPERDAALSRCRANGYDSATKCFPSITK